LFSGLDHAARSRPVTGFDELVGEHSTKGGLNEQVLEGHRKVNLSAIDLCDLSAWPKSLVIFIAAIGFQLK